MAIKATVESIDELPEAMRGLYAEKDGKFILDVEPVNGFALEDVGGLKTTLSKEMTKRKNLEKEFSKFKDIDPERAREALAKLEELSNIDPSKEADKIVSEKLETAKRQLLDKHSKDLAEREGKISNLNKTIENLLVDQSATSAIAEAKGSVELLLPHVQRHTRVREVDGRYVVEVIDKDGNARIGNSKGDPMTIKDLVAEMRQSETFGRAFDGSGMSGSGTPPGGSGGTPQRVTKKSDLDTRQKRAAFVEQYGVKAYDSLPSK